MFKNKKLIPDVLFIIQILGATAFCIAYTIRSVTDITGSSIAQFGLVNAFLLFHLALSISAHKVAPSRTTRQAIATYVTWFVLVSILILVVGTNSDYQWNNKDTTTIISALILTIIVLIIGKLGNRRLSDPMIKAFFAIAYKSVPQVLLAWKFLSEGGSGTPTVSIILGHVTILIRLGQLYFMIKEAGWDRNRSWLAISETANELSWIIATIAWLIVL